ncbi:MAG: cutinase family protein [Polyangiales bacterium]
MALSFASSLVRGTSALLGRHDVELVFARGSGEIPGLGIVGRPFARALRRSLPDRRVGAYAVRYRAHWNQTTVGAGATDLVDHIVELARRHPKMQFVLGGYSQGAMVVYLALGGRVWTDLAVRGEYKTLPAQLAPRIKAIALFGNPLVRWGARMPGRYASITRDFCNAGDPVCSSGRNFIAHLTYGTNGSTDRAATFSAQRVRPAVRSAARRA